MENFLELPVVVATIGVLMVVGVFLLAFGVMSLLERLLRWLFKVRL